jgi:protein involved in polysaccharide export with SLBB domain
MTLDKGIKMARGVTVEAAVTKVTLIREGENPATLDLKAIQRGQTKDVELKPGDRVHVPER